MTHAGVGGTWPSVRSTMHAGIVFTEENPPGTTFVKRIEVSISRQNSHLSEVKDRMAADAVKSGALAIVNFRYGQRSHKWWQQMFSFKWDSESWYGEGDAVTY